MLVIARTVSLSRYSLCAAAMIFALGPVPSSAAPLQWPAPVEGLSVLDHKLPTGVVIRMARTQGSNLILIDVSKSAGPAEQRAQGIQLDQFAGRQGVRVAITGPYLRSFSPTLPRGFIKIGGEITNVPFDSWLVSGVLCFVGEPAPGAKIAWNSAIDSTLSFDAFRKVAEAWQNCIQAGPILVEKGKPVLADILKVRYPRSPGANIEQIYDDVRPNGFACLTGRDIVVGLTGRLALKSLIADFLVRPEQDGGLGCDDAIRLFSNVEASMYVKSLSPQVLTVEPSPHVIFIGVK